MRASTVDLPGFAAETDALLDRLAAGYEPPDEPDPSVDVADLCLPLRGGPVPVRVYRSPGREPCPLVLWLHGGGFVGGSVADLDHPCSNIARRAGVVLVSLEYRLAPAHPFPAALHDTRDAIDWLRRHGGLLGGDGRLAAGGQSAGGNLVAAACLMQRDTGAPTVDRQVLCYPVLDFGQDTESTRAFNGVFHSATDDRHDRYLGDLPVTQYAAPLRAQSLAGLPPALVIGGGRDPLRDDARTYARRLDAEGTDVVYVEYAHTMHAILNFCTDLSAGRHLIELIAADLRGWSGGDEPSSGR
jgi:acetyl esterase